MLIETARCFMLHMTCYMYILHILTAFLPFLTLPFIPQFTYTASHPILFTHTGPLTQFLNPLLNITQILSHHSPSPPYTLRPVFSFRLYFLTLHQVGHSSSQAHPSALITDSGVNLAASSSFLFFQMLPPITPIS